MTSHDLQKIDIPDHSGVYFFQKGPDILYIGKATSLRSRVKSYFNNEGKKRSCSSNGWNK